MTLAPAVEAVRIGPEGIPERACANCAGSMDGLRSHAVYCSRRCKTAASDRRRRDSGRERARSRARYQGEAEQRREWARHYHAEHPEKVWEWRLRKRARRLGAALYEVTWRDWTRLLARYRHRCAYCGSTDELTCDHVVPLTRGGAHSIGNIVPACRRCNTAKRSRFVVEWRAA